MVFFFKQIFYKTYSWRNGSGKKISPNEECHAISEVIVPMFANHIPNIGTVICWAQQYASRVHRNFTVAVEQKSGRFKNVVIPIHHVTRASNEMTKKCDNFVSHRKYYVSQFFLFCNNNQKGWLTYYSVVPRILL